MGLHHSVQKGSEMPADYLSRNVVESIEISDEDLASLQDKDTFCKSIKNLLQDKPIDVDYRECHCCLTSRNELIFVSEVGRALSSMSAKKGKKNIFL